MAIKRIDISELDFDDIKTNLKTFLSQQDKFTDYNFEGSGMSILLDLLAYNTHYLAFHSNMLANEMFLDTATQRNSVVSLAGQLGYTPSSAKAPTAVVNVNVNNATGSSLTMAKGTKFLTVIDDVSYNFVNRNEITISPSDGVYSFNNLTIYEGTLASYSYTVDSSNTEQKFLIPNKNVDIDTLRVTVQTSSSDSTTNTYTRATTIKELSSTSKVYFLQEVDNGQFEVYFGDGVIGDAVEDGNIVTLEYIVTNKTNANGASSFTVSGTIGGFSNVTVTTVTDAQGGAEPESTDTIKFNAPKSYSAQDRAVTVEDYKIKVRELYPNAQSVSAWGGEDNDTPFYGRVFISIKPTSGSNLTTSTKQSIVTQLKSYSVASVTPVIVDPETTDILLNSTIKYDSKLTTKSIDDIRSLVNTTLTNYNTATLQQFDGVYRYSKISRLIDETDTSILSNITTLNIRKSFTPTIGSSTRYEVNFANALYNPHSEHNKNAGGILSSTGFKINGNNNEVFLDDDGAGNIRLYYLTTGSVRTYLNNTQGTINYNTGSLVINSLDVSSISNIRGSSSSIIELTVKPSSNDIVPVRNQVLNIDVANSTITVESDTFVGGSANAGVGYTTTSSY